MRWVSVEERYPSKEGVFLCKADGFEGIIKCRFRKRLEGPHEWCPELFLHHGRVPFTTHWWEDEDDK